MSAETRDFSGEEAKAAERSRNLRETNIRLITENWTAVQVTKLLAYIRDAVRSSENEGPATIKLTIGKNVKGGTFSFTVNDQEISTLRAQKVLEIN